MDKITFNFRIDRATRNKFKKIAEANGTNATTLLTQWINEYIASNSQDSNYSKDKIDESAQTNVSVNNQTTEMERVKDANTEELNKLWGAIFQHEKELRKLNAKIQRRKTETDRKVDHAELLNYFSGWSVPVNQEISLDGRINQLESNSLAKADLEGVQCLLPDAIAPDTTSKNAYHQSLETEQYKEGISFSRLAEILGISKSYVTKWQQGEFPNNKSRKKTKQAYEQWKQWYLGNDQRWYRRKN